MRKQPRPPRRPEAGNPRCRRRGGAGASRRSRSRGYALAELVVVVAILGVAAAVALPSTSAVTVQQLDLAAAELADAFRFARDEARRTGAMHGVSVSTDGTILRVFRVDETVTPPGLVFDVMHPLTRQKYLLQPGGADNAGVRIGTVAGVAVAPCGDAKNLGFDRHGAVRCLSPFGTLFREASVAVTAGVLQATVSLDGVSGQVVVK